MKTVEIEKPVVQNEEVCCAKFDPTPWHHTEFEWHDKLFLKTSIPEIMHIPLPGSYDKAIKKMWKTAEDAHAAPRPEEFLLLAHDLSSFKGELYMSITKDIPGADVVKLSGKYVSKVFDGGYNHVPQYISEMNGYLASMGKKAKKFYFYFTTCPKCAKKYGHNYIVALAQI
jgi:hypothetical protein